ncbi:hypothetical protein BGZ88_005166 [Linnemannia elongata]|nr:hypothetical protein BGZ88_005166 [Linnemannia elongata]
MAEVIAQALFKKANSGPPRPPTQTRAQQQQQLQYPLSTTICCIYLLGNDKIRLINAPSSLVSSLRLAIIKTWNQHILAESRLDFNGGREEVIYEFRVGGQPWALSPKTGPFITSTNLVLAMKKAMETRGWSLVLASNVSRVREENDLLVFECRDSKAGSGLPLTPSQERDPDEITLIGESEQKNKNDHKNGGQNQEREQVLSDEGSIDMLNVELSGYDTIRVSEAPTVIITALRLAILRHWTQGIEKESDKKGVHEFTLTGCPFQTWGAETTFEVSMVIIQALENMQLHGFKLVESTDLDVIGSGNENDEFEGKAP